MSHGITTELLSPLQHKILNNQKAFEMLLDKLTILVLGSGAN